MKHESQTGKALLTIILSAAMALLYACNSDNSDISKPLAGADLLPQVDEAKRVYVSDTLITNLEATVPPQCYTKTEAVHNPCYVCHQNYDNRSVNYRMNQLDDGGFRGNICSQILGSLIIGPTFFKIGRGGLMRLVMRLFFAISMKITTVNYLQSWSEITGLVLCPTWKTITWRQTLLMKGLALDGSGWVAFNYKPLPSTFWPTNGSTDDVVIRLPEHFRTLGGVYNESVYLTNLSLLELNIKSLDSIQVFPVSENTLAQDLDGDQQFSDGITHIRQRSHYVGDASGVALLAQQFPLGTQIMHSVRYVGVSEAGHITVPARMKELRYMEKIRELSNDELSSRYDRERKEKLQEELPGFVDHDDRGFSNGMGWLVQGFIEDYEGELRPQTFEETLFCMGCHSAIGTTIDQTFSFARKITGPSGWGYINLRGMRDAPSVTQIEGEILQYLKMSGGGNEFRQNEEMRCQVVLSGWQRENIAN